MAYIGRVGGPRTSNILQSKVGAAALGLEPYQMDIEWEDYAEASGTVMPVHIDENDQPFYLFVGNKTVVYRFSASEIEQLGSGFKFKHEQLPKEYKEIQG